MNKKLYLIGLSLLITGFSQAGELEGLQVKEQTLSQTKEILEVNVFKVSESVSVQLPKIKDGNTVCVYYVSALDRKSNEMLVKVSSYCNDAIETTSKNNDLLYNLGQYNYFYPKGLVAIEIIKGEYGYYQKAIINEKQSKF